MFLQRFLSHSCNQKLPITIYIQYKLHSILLPAVYVTNTDLARLFSECKMKLEVKYSTEARG